MRIILGSILSRVIVPGLRAGAVPVFGPGQRSAAVQLSLAAGLALLLPAAAVRADAGVYQTPDSFVAQAFPDGSPDARALWLRSDLRQTVSNILDRPAAPRIRYWQQGEQTVWVLEEIGKDQPITAGVVVQDGAIRDIRVLVFRESRGWEVKHPFFTRQFEDARLTPDGSLSQDIDGITGATLSVRAMTRMARVALLLDAQTRKDASDLARAPARASARR